MAATAAQKRASGKYDRKNTRQIQLKLNLTGDADILKKLDETKNKQGYIKNLIRSDIRGNSDILTQDAIRLLILPVAKKYKLGKIYLFGSYARGEATSESDIDLMIEGCNIDGFQGYQQLVDAFQKALGKGADIAEYEAVMQNTTRSGRRFLEHFEKDKVLIYDQFN